MHGHFSVCLSVVQEQRRQEAYEEFLKEKLMIDEIVRKIYEEDQRYAEWHTLYWDLVILSIMCRELEAMLEKRKATQRYIEEFKQKREEVSYYLFLHFSINCCLVERT